MNIKDFKFSIVVALLLLSTSCTKFLDEKSDKNLVELKSLDDLQALLDHHAFMNTSTPSYGETSADDYFVLVDGFNSLNDLQKAAYSWQYEEYEYVNDWSDNYRAVFPANYCINYLEKIKKTSQNMASWNNVMGTALFHRAFRYLNLIWEYGKAYDENMSQNDLGISLRLNHDPSIPSKRENVKDCYDKIIQDGSEAIHYLPDNPQHPMRPSKAAAYSLLARTFLSMRNYESAYKYADSALQIKNDLLDYNDVGQVDPFSQTPFQPFNKEIIFFSTQSNNFIAKHPAYMLVDTLLYSTYSDQDKRKSVFFFSNNGYQSFKGNYHSDFYTYFSGIATDEIYLIRSECHARANRITEAMDDLNTLLANRWESGVFTPISAATQQEALQIILLERRKELIMRGLRWIDIKRLNKEGANIELTRILDQTYNLLPNDDKFALPLPEDILNITGIPQNPGW